MNVGDLVKPKGVEGTIGVIVETPNVLVTDNGEFDVVKVAWQGSNEWVTEYFSFEYLEVISEKEQND